MLDGFVGEQRFRQAYLIDSGWFAGSRVSEAEILVGEP